MLTTIPWGQDIAPSQGDAGLESFTLAGMTQGPNGPVQPAFFKSMNIINESGKFYATLYACMAMDGSDNAQALAIWLSSLKATDCVHLTLASMQLDVPLTGIITLMNAVATTKARIVIHLDQLVGDGLAYFYLLATEVRKGVAGALYIPSYLDQRAEDASQSTKAVNGLYKWVVDNAVTTGRLTAEEASSLHRGKHVVIPDDRFAA
jgi:hypothetical protein